MMTSRMLREFAEIEARDVAYNRVNAERRAIAHILSESGRRFGPLLAYLETEATRRYFRANGIPAVDSLLPHMVESLQTVADWNEV